MKCLWCVDVLFSKIVISNCVSSVHSGASVLYAIFVLMLSGRQCRQLVLSENAPEDLEGTVNAGTVAGDTGGAGEGVGDERRSVVGGTSSIAETSIATGDGDRVRSFWVALNHAGIPLNKLITLLFNFIYLGEFPFP